MEKVLKKTFEHHIQAFKFPGFTGTVKPVLNAKTGFSAERSSLIAVRHELGPGTGGLLRVEGPVSAVEGTLGAPGALLVRFVVYALVVPVTVFRVGFEETIHIHAGVTRATITNPAISGSGRLHGGSGSRAGRGRSGPRSCRRGRVGSINAEAGRRGVLILTVLRQRVEDKGDGDALVHLQGSVHALEVLVAVTRVGMVVGVSLAVLHGGRGTVDPCPI